MARSQEEFELHCVIADLLRAACRPGVHWFHIPNGEERPKKQNKQGQWYSPSGNRLKRMGCKAGEPDFIFLIGGDKPMTVGMELKLTDKKSKPSDAQEQTKLEWSLASHLYRTANGYREAFDFLKQMGIIRVSNGDPRFQPRETEPNESRSHRTEPSRTENLGGGPKA